MTTEIYVSPEKFMLEGLSWKEVTRRYLSLRKRFITGCVDYNYIEDCGNFGKRGCYKSNNGKAGGELSHRLQSSHSLLQSIGSNCRICFLN